MDLSDSGLERFAIPDGELALVRHLDLPRSTTDIFAELRDTTPWKAEAITLFKREHLQPRLTAWYGDAPYTYSGLRMEPLPWTPLLSMLRAAVEAASNARFNSVLLNFYRNERDSMGMHSDDEAELGRNPVIASLSLGATRTFILRHKRSGQTLRLPLEDGMLLLMGGTLQHHWLHGINKATRPIGPRINLTFRQLA